MNPYKKQDLNKFLDKLTPEFIEEKNHQQSEENKAVHKEFISNLRIGKCFMCGLDMNAFIESKPCFHWFTYPSGIKKKNFEKYLQNPIGFFQLDSYFRWLANSEVFMTNINDLKDETSSMSYLETTYKYKNIEWAFSIGKTDLEGHSAAKVGNNPHYHIQMKVNDNIFLKFNDFHIPFSDQDLFVIELQEQASDKVVKRSSIGAGMSVIEDTEFMRELDEHMLRSANNSTAPFNRQTIIIAQEGESITDEMINNAYEESKRTNIPVSKIIHNYLPGAEVIVQITPGEGMPPMTKRSGKK